MGFYFRKSFGSNLFRINFSKSGISYSTGVKGARINFSSRGTYVNFGSNGIYYRKKISDFGNTNFNKPTYYNPPVNPELHTITSSAIEEITDTDSRDFIGELTEKNNKISYFNWFGIPISILVLFSFFYIFFSTTRTPVSATKTKYSISSLSPYDINVRRMPSKTGEIVGTFGRDKKFVVTDTTNINWYKIDFDGIVGFVYKHSNIFITEETITEDLPDNVSKSIFDNNQILFWLIFILLAIIIPFYLKYLKKLDNQRLLVEIYYDLDEGIKEVYDKFISAFSSILNCDRKWQYLHSQDTHDYKYTSGASSLVNRKLLSNISKHKTPSNIFRTNVQIPFIGLINTDLYFFPERLIIKRGNSFGAIMYKNIECFSSLTRFIETDGVPRDSEVVDQTWRYLNKNGSPDKRFNNNYRIPICQYSVYSFSSNSGLNEMISTSKVGGFEEFVKLLKLFGGMQNKITNYGGDADISLIK